MSLGYKVEEVAAHYLRNARRMGEDNLKASCPFHEEGDDRTFSISLKSGAWICFHSNCPENAGGSFVTLLRKLGLTPNQIDRMVEGIQPPVPVPDFLRIKAELAEEPVFLPEYILGAWSTLPKPLLDAGYSEELLRSFDVGFDSKRRRIVFPVRDYVGRLAAISGRAIDPWVSPRYKVYDARRYSGELYGIVEKYIPDNRRHLYGYFTVYPERFFKSETGCPPLILVEGFKACLWMRQLGFSHTVALQGSSLSSHQRRLLQRLSGPFYVMLDHQPGKSYPDRFGLWAALKIAEELSSAGPALVCQYGDRPPNTQPSDLQTKEEVEAILRAAKSATQLRLEQHW